LATPLSKLGLPAGFSVIKNFYINLTGDPLLLGLSRPHGWFDSLLCCEAIFQRPVFAYAAWKLSLTAKGERDALRLPLLVYSVHATTTIIPCIGQMISFDPKTVSYNSKFLLLSVYLPMLFVTAPMAIDSYREITLQTMKYSKSK
jgi:hypothetical protein